MPPWLLFPVELPPRAAPESRRGPLWAPVADPYRWLEDADAAQTRNGSPPRRSSGPTTGPGLSDRETFAGRVRELLRVGSVGLPAWRGTTQFYTRRDPDQEHAVLYVADTDAISVRTPPRPRARARPSGR